MSGIALRRIMLPFVARLTHLSNVNRKALRSMVGVYNANRAALGLEVFSVEPSAIDIDWKWRELFQDDPAEEESDE